jgi:multicomponent Na+:H+ antiporter subunit D
VLVLAALVFSWRYFADAHVLYHVLMLLFLGAMCGFALTGDLFNMFVWFELMGVAAYALTGYKVEEAGPLQGALNFAITNSLGGFMVLFGTALVYGHTGALNLAQIGKSVRDQRVHGLLLVAFLLLLVGFLVKAAAVPFHFWLADAHAVAPATVCVLLSGVMVELGLYAVARVYWSVFSGPVGSHAVSLRDALIALGVLTALVGAAMSFLQRHVKRLLAFSTISHAGVVLIGIALLHPKGLAGAAIETLAHGLTKASLFLAMGIVLHRLQSVDELRLHGRGRSLPITGCVFLLGGLSLAGLPPFGSYLGHSLIEEAARELGYGWVGPVVLVAAIVSTAAVFRAAARIFLGWGAQTDELLSREPDERDEPERRGESSLPLQVIPTVALALAGFGLSLAAGLAPHAEDAARQFVDRRAYAAAVLHDRLVPIATSPSLALPTFGTASVVYGVAATAGALLVAAWGLWRPSLGIRLLVRAVEPLKAAHSGHVGDYVAWLVAGAALLGGVFALTIRG